MIALIVKGVVLFSGKSPVLMKGNVSFTRTAFYKSGNRSKNTNEKRESRKQRGKEE
jgi:hypothetical protein